MYDAAVVSAQVVSGHRDSAGAALAGVNSAARA